jgi:hypothetical protein
MKILIQHRVTGHFFKALGQWTSDIEEGRNFEGALVAFQFAELHQLANTEVVFKKPFCSVQSVLNRQLASTA